MRKFRGINLAIAILSGILLLFIAFITIQINSDKIAKNIHINDIDVGGLTQEEALEKISNKIEMKEVTFVYDDKCWKIHPDDIEAKYNYEKTVENAFNINRKSNFINNLIYTLKSNLGIDKNINIVVECNENKVKQELKDIAKSIDVKMINASLDVSNGQVIINEEKSGLQVDIEKTTKLLKKSLQNGKFKETLIVIKVEPEVKKEDLKTVDTLLGSYSTSLQGSSPGRLENIKLAAEKTSGVLLMPGEEYSYNEHTGERNAANGYKNATVIVSGEAVQGVGGGVCQVSTTLYNAVLYAGLDIVKVSNHSIPSSYVDKGRDATVSNGSIDFVFKNNYDLPVYIKNYYSNGRITCQVYGNSKDKKNIEIVTSTDKVGEFTTRKENDPTLDKGVEKVIENGRKSYSVSTYRVYYENGVEVKREKVATSYYPAKQQVIAIGTKVSGVVEVEEGTTGSEGNNNNNSSNNNTDNNSSNNNNNNNNSSNNNTNDENTENTDNEESIVQ